MNKAGILKSIVNNWPISFLTFISLTIAFLNYTPGTFLSGWDALHPEFNFALTFERAINGVFRTEQGLGAVAAHSHMADLPRIFLLYLEHFVIPLSFLRYSYVFLNLIAGPIGMYFFLNRIVLKNKNASFLGSLFYLLNLGTMQQFVVPFEMFTTQYAALPWLFLFASQYLYSTDKNRKVLLLFSITTLFSAPMAYAATLWYVYFFSLILYLIFLSVKPALEKNFFYIKRALVLIALTFIINSFWILPNLYFLKTQSTNVSQANINKLFSPQAFLYNKEFGNIKDIALQKTFLFDWGVYSGNNRFEPLLSSWIAHLDNPFVLKLGYFFSLISLFGFCYSVYKKNKIGISLSPVLFISIFFLINDNPPTGAIYNFFRQNFPLFKEALRFPDDKVLGLFTFVFAVYFAFGQMAIIRIGKIYQVVFFTGLLLFFMLPAFEGNLINPNMRIKIPQGYFEMFDWFNAQDNQGKIANFPINSFWGWEYYDWNYHPSFQGAGFLWFGIKQPLLARDFDRWNPSNEQYYREMSYAVYSKNPRLFNLVIDKYNIEFIILDKSVISPEQDPKTLFLGEIENLLENSGKVYEKRQFGNTLYTYKLKPQQNSSFLKDIPSISPPSYSFYEDFVYQKYGNYVAEDNSNNYFPFRNLINNQGLLKPEKISLTQKGPIINFANNGNITLPSLIDNEKFLPADLLIEKNKNKINVIFYPHVPFEDTYSKPIPISIPLKTLANNFVLSINGTYNFILNDVPQNSPLSLGNVMLDSENNFVGIYSSIENLIIDFSKINYSLSPCENTGEQHLFGIDLLGKRDSFYLFGENMSVCMTVPLTEIFSIDNLNNEPAKLLNIKYNYSGDSYSSVCFSDLKTGSCINYVVKDLDSRNQGQRNYYFGVESSKLYSTGLKIFLDATQTKGLKKVLYENFSYSLSPAVSSANFSGDILRSSIIGINKTLSNELIVPFSGNSQLSKDITSLPKTSGSCDKNPFTNNTGVKKQILNSQSENYIRYSSELGSSCDHFSYQNLSQDNAYLFALKSKNVKGLPLTVCILNQSSRHCDIYTKLTNSKTGLDLLLLPPMIKGENGYDINVSNLGIKGSPSINDLESIEIIPFPYNFISNIQTNGYKNNDNVFVLPYSFDSGWKAYEIANSKWQMANWLPFLFGKELKEHVLVNNWANGWIIDNSQFIIIFWPQYLEYLGFALLLAVFTWIITPSLKKKLTKDK